MTAVGWRRCCVRRSQTAATGDQSARPVSLCLRGAVRLRGAMSFSTDTIAALATPVGTSPAKILFQERKESLILLMGTDMVRDRRGESGGWPWGGAGARAVERRTSIHVNVDGWMNLPIGYRPSVELT